MALDLAMSVRNVSSQPISVVTNELGSKFFHRYQENFDRILVDTDLDNGLNPNVFTKAKLASIRNSPYQYSIFLDSDVLVRRDPAHLFELCDEDGFVVMGRHYDRQSIGELRHHGLLVGEILEDLDLPSYVHCFLCCFVFSRNGGLRILEAMEDGLKKHSALDIFCGNGINDELLLGLVGDKCDLSFFPLDKPNQAQDFSFRWEDPCVFIHSAPMRNVELLKTIRQVIRTRIRFEAPRLPAIFWLNELLKRRAEINGRSRRQFIATQRLIQKLFLE